jgi:tripartite-type tricarboxylate transporter receptor subunit TctC
LTRFSVEKVPLVFSRRTTLLAGLSIPAGVQAQSSWPDRPIRVFVPTPPGAAPDIIAREIAEQFTRRLGQPFPVENRPGADGLLGAEALLAARPGEALLISPAGALTLVPMLRNPPLPVDPLDALTPMAALASDVLGLFAAPELTGTMPEVIARMRRAGAGGFNWYASPGPPALVMRAFLREADLEDLVHISYRGVPPALIDLSSGRLHLLFVPQAGALPLLRDGRVRLLAVAGNDRNAAVLDVPTSKEMGFPSLFLEGLIALFGWRGMPTQSMELLAREANTALASLDDRLMARGQIARRERLADLASLLRSDRARFAALLREFPVRD